MNKKNNEQGSGANHQYPLKTSTEGPPYPDANRQAKQRYPGPDLAPEADQTEGRKHVGKPADVASPAAPPPGRSPLPDTGTDSQQGGRGQHG